MLERSYHSRNHHITTVVDGSICTGNHLFGEPIWDKLPWWIFENLEILIFSKILKIFIPKIAQTKHMVTG